MKLPTQLPTLVLVLIFSAAQIATAQQDKDAVILYNSQPVKVELSAVGKILSFYGLAPGYMDGYDLGPSINNGPTVSETVNTVDATFTDESQNAEYDIVSNDRVFIDFQEGFATLSKSTISSLNEVVQRIKSEQNRKVLLTVYGQGEIADKLLKNRLNSALAYLNIKGLNNSQIITEVRPGQELRNKLSVNYID